MELLIYLHFLIFVIGHYEVWEKSEGNVMNTLILEEEVASCKYLAYRKANGTILIVKN